MANRIGIVPFWKSYDRKAVLRIARAGRGARLRLDLGARGVGLRAVPAPDRDRARDQAPRLATGIANVFSRSPGLLAMSAATLDEISEGRAILGLGTSGKIVVENFHGVPYEKPLTRLRETIGICRALWRGDRLEPELSTLFDARHFKLEMTPLRAGHPDLHRVAAGEGDPRGRPRRRRLGADVLALRAPQGRHARCSTKGARAAGPRPVADRRRAVHGRRPASTTSTMARVDDQAAGRRSTSAAWASITTRSSAATASRRTPTSVRDLYNAGKRKEAAGGGERRAGRRHRDLRPGRALPREARRVAQGTASARRS